MQRNPEVSRLGRPRHHLTASPRFRPATLLVLGWIALLLFGLSARGSAYVYTFRPVADTVAKQANPDTNYGTSTSLPIRHQTTGNAEYSFLRFSLPSLAGTVTSATLTLHVTGTIQEVGSYAVTMGNPTWGETWLTWNNWLSGSSWTYLGSQYNLAWNSDLNVNVTGYVGTGNVTFAVASSEDVTGQSFSSKEGLNTPVLTIVTTGNPPSCSGPEEMLGELDSLVETGNLLYGCNYKADLSPYFTAWSGGSQNKPVIAAAAALFDGPVVDGIDYRTWWQDFFNHQASTSGTGNVDYFKGTELFSTVYDGSTVVGVLVARYWGYLHGHSTIRDAAGAYLKRTWYAWALGTSPTAWDAIYRDVGSTRTYVAGAQKWCPTLAFASPRSKMDYGQDTKRWVLAKMLGYNTNCYIYNNHKPLVSYVVSHYSSASGLTSTELNRLHALINNTTIPSDLGSVLGAVRMRTDFHWLLWDDGRRATYYLGSQLNGNISYSGGKHTIFTSIFDPSTKDVDLLFAEGTGNSSCIDVSSRRIFIDNDGNGTCSSSSWIALPLDEPDYHYVLGPNGLRSCSSLNC